MNARTFFRGFVFLLLLFVVLYIGMENRHSIDFYFPMLLAKKVSQPAAIVFFAMFAIGVIAGMALNAGGSGKSGDGESARRRK